jgi:hypothetical protein
LITLTLSSCQDSVAPPANEPSLSRTAGSSAPLVLHRILPRLTGPQTGRDVINWQPTDKPEEAQHYAWLDTSWNKSNPKLLVFMPGTNFRPWESQLVGEEAARLGYHVIGLMYQNNVGVDAKCKGSSDVNCSGDMRLEILTGVDISTTPDISTRVDVTPANGIDNRLSRLLMFLADSFPDEGWSRFLDPGADGRPAPKWSQIAVAGHSQGAGQAALIGKLRHVDRVVMFSGPPDARKPDTVDAWVSIGKTPAAKYFGLFHEFEPLGPGIGANLTALDMTQLGDTVRVTGDAGESPYGGAHVLITRRERPGAPAIPNRHRSTAMDAYTPLRQGCTQVTLTCALLADAWRYMLGEPPHGGADKSLVARIP